MSLTLNPALDRSQLCGGGSASSAASFLLTLLPCIPAAGTGLAKPLSGQVRMMRMTELLCQSRHLLHL
jgi:hypothetical protein